jgi:hypothetical protein
LREKRRREFRFDVAIRSIVEYLAQKKGVAPAGPAQ